MNHRMIIPAALLALLLAVGCREPLDREHVVDFWGMGREGEVVEQLLPEFRRRHPDISVQVQQIPWSAAHEKLLTAFVGDAMPDVFQIGNTWLPEFVALGAVQPIEPLVARSTIVVRNDYFAGVLDTNIVGGALHAVPWYVDTRLLFYRTDLVAAAGSDEPPRTWETWIETMERIRQRTGRYGILLPVRDWYAPVILAFQLGADLLRDEDQYGNFQSPAFRKAFAFYIDLFRRGLTPRAAEAQVANLYQDFADGYFAFLVTGPWNIGEFGRRLPAAVQDRWSTAPFPAPDARYPGVSVAGGASLAISRRSRQPAAAWTLVEYLSEPPQQVEFYRLTGDLPARRSAWENPSLRGNPHAQAFWVQLQSVRALPKIPEWERVATMITQYVERTVRGDLSIDDALAGLDREVDAILAKRRWLMHRAARAAADRGSR